MTIQINSTLLETIQGDIAAMESDIIVHSANASLSGGAGADGAVLQAGGIAIHDELMRVRNDKGGCSTGDAVITTAGKLPAAYVIHAVGPVWQGGEHDEERLLGSCYRRAMELAEAKKARSLSFPAISTGIYGYPKDLAAQIAFSEVMDYLRSHEETSIKRVAFVCSDEENCRQYGMQMKRAYRL